MKTYRLLDKHSFVQRFGELCEHAQRLGISIQFMGFRTIAYDTQNDKTYEMADIGNEEDALGEFPPATEVRFTYEKDVK